MGCVRDVSRRNCCGLAIDDEGVNREINEGVNEGVNVLLDVIRRNPGKRANEFAGLIGRKYKGQSLLIQLH